MAWANPPSSDASAFDLGTNTTNEAAGDTRSLGCDALVLPVTLSSGGSTAPSAGLSIGYGDNLIATNANAAFAAPVEIPVGHGTAHQMADRDRWLRTGQLLISIPPIPPA